MTWRDAWRNQHVGWDSIWPWWCWMLFIFSSHWDLIALLEDTHTSCFLWVSLYTYKFAARAGSSAPQLYHHTCLLSTDSNTTWRLYTELCWHHVTASNGDFVYFQATYVFYTHWLNGYFPGEWVSRLPIDNKGHWSKFLWVGCPSSHPTNSVKALKD